MKDEWSYANFWEAMLPLDGWYEHPTLEDTTTKASLILNAWDQKCCRLSLDFEIVCTCVTWSWGWGLSLTRKLGYVVCIQYAHILEDISYIYISRHLPFNLSVDIRCTFHSWHNVGGPKKCLGIWIISDFKFPDKDRSAEPGFTNMHRSGDRHIHGVAVS